MSTMLRRCDALRLRMLGRGALLLKIAGSPNMTEAPLIAHEQLSVHSSLSPMKTERWFLPPVLAARTRYSLLVAACSLVALALLPASAPVAGKIRLFGGGGSQAT